MPSLYPYMAVNNKKISVFLFLLILITFWGSLENSFVWDDKAVILKDPSLRSLSTLFNPDYPDSRRPITFLSFYLDFHLWRLNPFWYHLENILLHAINTILLFLLSKRLFNEKTALFSAIIFAVHPVHTESVYWLMDRSGLLSAMFFFIAFLTYIKIDKTYEKHFVLYYFVFIISFVLSIFSKEIGMGLIPLLIVYDISNKRLRERAKYYVLFILLALIYILFWARGGAITALFSSHEYWGGSPYRTFLAMMTVIVEYIRLLFYPINLQAWYITKIPETIFEFKAIIGMLMLLTLLVTGMFYLRKNKVAGISILWVLVTLLPVSNIIPIAGSMMAERWLYIPSAGFCIAIGSLIERTLSFSKKTVLKYAVISIFAVLTVAFFIKSEARHKYWKNDFTVFYPLTKIYPDWPVAHYYLGRHYIEKKEYDRALDEFVNIRVDSPSDISDVSKLIGIVYREKGNYGEAEKYFQKAIAISPDNKGGYTSLATIYRLTGRSKEAIDLYKKAIEIDPNFPLAHNQIGMTYLELGDTLSAFKHLKKAIELEPLSIVFRLSLAEAYEKTDDKASALIEYLEVRRIAPQNNIALDKIKELEGLK